MAEYIDRKSLIDEFDRLGLGEHSFVERVFSDGVRTIIAGIPAADVAPVVRCKDCAHRTEMGNCGHPRYHGILPSAYPYDFCSYGARMDDGACSQVCKYNTPDRGCVAGELGARCDLTNVAGERGNGEAG